ncbi:MAG: YdcH family protein [Nitrosopumilus sp.]|nr:YdcH family protein [Nitrosopumilus sp.]
MTTIDTVKEELIKENQIFRELVQQHQDYEKRLTELAELTYPSSEELLEETTLKKKKLFIKDEIYEMIQNHSKSH